MNLRLGLREGREDREGMGSHTDIEGSFFEVRPNLPEAAMAMGVIGSMVVRGSSLVGVASRVVVVVVGGPAVRGLQNQKALSGQSVVFMGHQTALKSLGQTCLSDRPLHQGLECGKRIQHRGRKHVARHPADGIKTNVGHGREPEAAWSAAASIMSAGRLVPMPSRPSALNRRNSAGSSHTQVAALRPRFRISSNR